jgi:hypothetical protein
MGPNVYPYHWIDDHPPIWEINITGWWLGRIIPYIMENKCSKPPTR